MRSINVEIIDNYMFGYTAISHTPSPDPDLLGENNHYAILEANVHMSKIKIDQYLPCFDQQYNAYSFFFTYRECLQLMLANFYISFRVFLLKLRFNKYVYFVFGGGMPGNQ